MRRKTLISIVAIAAVFALTLSVSVFASGCGDDEVTSGGRVAQQVDQRPGDGDDCRDDGRRGMKGRQGEDLDADRDGICDQDGDCLGRGDCDADCDGDCDERHERPGDSLDTDTTDEESSGSEAVSL